MIQWVILFWGMIESHVATLTQILIHCSGAHEHLVQGCETVGSA